MYPELADDAEASRLSRGTQQLYEIVSIIKKRYMRLMIVGSTSIDCRNGDIDPMRQAFIQMPAVFAELEQSIIRARGRHKVGKSKGTVVAHAEFDDESIMNCAAVPINVGVQKDQHSFVYCLLQDNTTVLRNV